MLSAWESVRFSRYCRGMYKEATMRKKISEMTAADKASFLEATKIATEREQGVPWEFMQQKLLDEIEATFDDVKFAKMDPDFAIDAAYARKYFNGKKPELVDYMLWMLLFVTKSDIVEW